MAAVLVFAGNHLGTGGICLLCQRGHIDTSGVRVYTGTGLFGAGDYLFRVEIGMKGTRFPERKLYQDCRGRIGDLKPEENF